MRVTAGSSVGPLAGGAGGRTTTPTDTGPGPERAAALAKEERGGGAGGMKPARDGRSGTSMPLSTLAARRASRIAAAEGQRSFEWNESARSITATMAGGVLRETVDNERAGEVIVRTRSSLTLPASCTNRPLIM